MTNANVPFYQNMFKRSAANPQAHQVYGQIIASESGMLSKLALQGGDHTAALNSCRTVLEFQSFLATPDGDGFVANCQQATEIPATK